MSAVIDDMALMTGYTFVVDPEVRGRVTIVSETPLTAAEAFQVFLSTLRVNGYAAVPTAPGVYQIVPDAEGVRSGAPLSSSGADAGILSSVYRLRHTSALDAVRAIAPMLSPSGAANSIPAGNLVVVVDYRLQRPGGRGGAARGGSRPPRSRCITLENLPAEDMARIVERFAPAPPRGRTIAPSRSPSPPCPPPTPCCCAASPRGWRDDLADAPH
jgi:general secretion pathway protein D